MRTQMAQELPCYNHASEEEPIGYSYRSTSPKHSTLQAVLQASPEL